MKIWNKVTPIIQVLKVSLFYVLSNDRVVIGIVMHVNGFKNDIGPCTDKSKVFVYTRRHQIKEALSWKTARSSVCESIQITLGQFSIV